MTSLLRAPVILAALLAVCASASHGVVVAQDVPLDRSARPAPGPTPEFDFPDVQRRTLSNGLRVSFVERPGVPLVTVRLLLDAGALAEPPEQSGLASLTAAMLLEGTATRTSQEIADELGFLAASLNAGAGRETTTVTMTTLARNLEPALGVLADVVVNPTFPENEWTRVRDQRVVALRQSLDQPDTLASRQFNRQVFGTAHPMGRDVQGTPASVQALTPERLRAFHQARYRPGRANLIVVGAVSADRLVAQLEAAFGRWRGGQADPLPALPVPPPQTVTRIYLVDKPGAAQSEVRIGHVGVPRTHPDYFPLIVMNTILGGQFTSRINLNLREDKGYSYGARSDFQMGRQAGPFVAGGAVQTAVTSESVIEFMRELDEVRGARPVTDAEVEFARVSLVRREPRTLETNNQIAGRIQDLILYDLPDDYFDHYTDRIEAVTTAEVNRVARAHLQPGRAAIVVVGDRAAIEPRLRELPYPVEVVPAELP